jgi:hypothetical protein
MLWEIIGFQYKISEITLRYISDTVIPYYADINPELADLYPQFFDISQTIWVLFVVTFILSFISFILWRLLWRLLKFQAYDAEKYRVVLLLNIFYIVPFIYGFVWGRIKIINIFLLLIGSWAYYAFKWLFSNPDAVINYFM